MKMRTLSEEALLGYLLTFPEEAHLAKIIYNLHPREFFHPPNKAIFEVIRDLFEAARTISLSSVSESILCSDIEEKNDIILHAANLNAKSSITLTDSTIDFYVSKIKEGYGKEKITQLLQKAVRQGLEDDTPISNLFDYTMQAQTLISELAADIRNPESIVSHGFRAIEQIEKKRISNHNKIFTGLPQLDECFGGFQDCDFVIIAARPNVGKTILLTQIFRACLPQQKKALFFSLEMAPSQIFARLQSINSSVSSSAFRNPELVTNEDMELIQASFEKMRFEKHDHYLFVEGSYKNPTIDRLRVAAYKQKQSVGLDVIFLDYLQLLRPRKPNITRPDLDVREVTQDLKLLAETLNVPIICVSALNREASEMKMSKNGNYFIRPQLGHLAGSSGIEYIADQVILIHRQEGAIETELYLAKNRWGPTKSINVTFDGAMSQFVPVDF